VVKVRVQPTTMGEGEGYGTKSGRKACESGWYVCDSRWKVPTVGHLGQRGRSRSSPEMPDDWNFPSAITHVPPTFARLPS